MKEKNENDRYEGDPIVEKILNARSRRRERRRKQFSAEDFVFLCQCGIMPDLSLDDPGSSR